MALVGGELFLMLSEWEPLQCQDLLQMRPTGVAASVQPPAQTQAIEAQLCFPHITFVFPKPWTPW